MQAPFHQVVVGHRDSRQVEQTCQVTARQLAVGDGFDRRNHLAQRRQELTQDFFGVRNQVQAVGVAPSQGDHLVELWLIDR
jgi:tRNA splicing ligase